MFRVDTGEFEVVVERNGHSIVVGRAGPGSVLGEISLLAGGRPSASATAIEQSTVTEIPREVASSIFEDADIHDELVRLARDRVNVDELAVLVADLAETDDTATVRDFIDASTIRDIEAGTTLYEVGDPADAAFLVVSGRLEAEGPQDASSEMPPVRVGRGQLLGESALFTPGVRADTARATRDSVVAEIGTQAFESLVSRHPRVMFNLARRILARMDPGRRRGHRSVSSVAVGITAPTNGRVLTTRLVNAIPDETRVGHLTTSSIDAALGRPGLAGSSRSDATVPRLASYLHEFELAHDLVVLEIATSDSDDWARRATAMADRVLIVTSPAPDAQEAAAIDRLLALIPERTTVIGALHHPADAVRPTGSAAMAARFGFDDVLHLRSGDLATIGRVARLVTSRGVGLALGGGGGRGFAHIGVYRAMHELGIPVDVVAGSSIGAPIAAGIAIGIELDSMVPLATQLFDNLLDYTIPVVSLIKGERITRSIDQAFEGWDFEDAWIPYRCVSTNLTRSRVETHSKGPIAPRVRASVAIPGVMPPVPDGDDLLIDGGVLNNLPADVIAADGRCDTIVAVDVAPPVGPRAKSDYGLSVSGWKALRSSVSRDAPSFPGITTVLMRTMLIGSMRDRQQALEEAPVDLLLQLDLRDVSLLDFERVAEVAQRGHDLAHPVLEEWSRSHGGWS